MLRDIAEADSISYYIVYKITIFYKQYFIYKLFFCSFHNIIIADISSIVKTIVGGKEKMTSCYEGKIAASSSSY